MSFDQRRGANQHNQDPNKISMACNAQPEDINGAKLFFLHINFAVVGPHFIPVISMR